MDSTKVSAEIGKKKIFAGAVDWPGWCRRGQDETKPLQPLIDYGSRYAQVHQPTQIKFQPPSDLIDIVVIEPHDGNSRTVIGAPVIVLDVDMRVIERNQRIMQACWKVFDSAVENARGKMLRKSARAALFGLRDILFIG